MYQKNQSVFEQDLASVIFFLWNTVRTQEPTDTRMESVSRESLSLSSKQLL